MAETRDLVCRATSRQIVSNVPIGCFLSGGIDSSIIARAMSLALGTERKLNTFSIGFEDPRYDESGYAAEVAQYLGTEHHEFRVRANALEDLPRIVAAYGEPFADSSALPTYYLSRATRGFVKVALSGDGGDELFGGYDRYRAMLLSRRIVRVTGIRNWQPIKPLFDLLALGHPKSRRTRAARFFRSLAMPPQERYNSYVRLFDEYLLEELRPRGDMTPPNRQEFGSEDIEAYLAQDRMNYLPDDLLTKVDRASMAFGLEVRSPFMDHELVGFAANLRTDQLLDSRGGKRMLRDAFAADLPASVFNRPKMGFAVPIGDWFRGELRSMLRDSLTASNSFASSNFNMQVVQRLIDDHESGRADHSQRLYALLMLELWWKTIAV